VTVNAPPPPELVALDAIDKDISRVHVRAAVALAIVAAVVTQFELRELRKLSGAWEGLILGALALLVLAAGAYLQYTQELNKTRLAIAAHVSGVQTLRAGTDNPWLKFIRPAGWRDKLKSGPLRWYEIGNAAFATGGIALTVVVGKLLI
jgi:hypothetical protein